MSIKIEKVTEPLLLGEGPHWDDQHQCLYYVSILEKSIHKYVPATETHTKTILDEYASFIIPVDGSTDQFVIAKGRKFLVVQWDGAEGSEVNVIRELGEVEQETPNHKLNDGKVDPRGRLFSGTMGLVGTGFNFNPGAGSIYRIDGTKGAKIEKVDSNITLANGLAWDLKEKAFYYVDSLERKVRRYDYDVETGDISNLTYIFDFEKYNLEGIPDGITIDTDGNLWVAVFNGSNVLKINPKTRELLMKLEIPARQVTSVTFAGPDYDILYVTTASVPENNEQPPPCGCVFKVTGLGVKGHPNRNFKL